MVGRGNATTPERIAELQQRAAEVERQSRPPPSRPFAQVLATGQPAVRPESKKERRRKALPRRGPRPALVHPVQREVFGREDDVDEPVVLKG